MTIFERRLFPNLVINNKVLAGLYLLLIFLALVLIHYELITILAAIANPVIQELAETFFSLLVLCLMLLLFGLYGRTHRTVTGTWLGMEARSILAVSFSIPYAGIMVCDLNNDSTYLLTSLLVFTLTIFTPVVFCFTLIDTAGIKRDALMAEKQRESTASA